MRKLLSGGLAVFAGIVSLPSPRSLHAERTPPVNRCKIDMRLERLKAFFGKLDCPAKDYTVDFIAAAERYGLDWRLLPSISYVESTGGKSAKNNNLFGWNCGRTGFASISESIHEVARRLGRSRLYRSKTLDQLLATYNPTGDYAQKVKNVMQRIAPAQ
jgi:Mannosyl-glycoprotein endo-beta-N-acetylglucosaminidase